MISLESIKKDYKLEKETIPVINGIDLDLFPGELTYLLGESGCGKSTLLNIIGGIDKASSGDYLFNGKSVKDYSEKEWAYFRRKKIGFVFQNFNLVSHLTAIENVELSMILEGKSKSERNKKSKELLELVGLKDREKHLPSQLSGGQKQRVAIARSLANDPDIILADEPTGALDSENSEQIMKILKKVANQGKIVLVVTHSQGFVDYADRIIQMKDGSIVDINVKNSNQMIESSSINNQLDSSKKKKINWNTTLKLAIRNIKNKKWRNTLTAIGASIGIFGMVTIGALGNGINEKIANAITGTDSNYSIGVYKDDTELLPTTVQDELSQVDNVKDVYAYNPFQISIETRDGKKTTASADTLVPEKYKTLYGKSYITHGDYPSNDSEVILPERVAEELYKNANEAIGKKVTIVSQLMSLNDVYPTVSIEATVTGLVKNGAIPLLDTVGFSYSLSQKITNENPQTKNTAMQYTVIPSSIDKVDSVIKNLQSKGYVAETESDSSEELSSYVTMASVAVGLLSGISLIVSSIMIGIVLYVSVLERTREIGTLKAIGAYRSDIRRIFVMEGFMIGLLGGIFGVAGSFIIGKLGNFIIKEGFDKPNLQLFQYDISQLVLIIIFSGLLGVAASFIPAYRAAKLNPVEALKYE
ncbi:ATP-binding cassette domain-containing protein [Niallia taxi]|nr:ABC transporter ATP-binding protein/permease [Niallia taxi]MDE5052963.1 ATP-binding cassette domain-containing protein [Niallia taxi]